MYCLTTGLKAIGPANHGWKSSKLWAQINFSCLNWLSQVFCCDRELTNTVNSAYLYCLSLHPISVQLPVALIISHLLLELPALMVSSLLEFKFCKEISMPYVPLYPSRPPAQSLVHISIQWSQWEASTLSKNRWKNNVSLFYILLHSVYPLALFPILHALFQGRMV
jgi:hypothetical protein